MHNPSGPENGRTKLPIRRYSFILSIWAEPRPHAAAVWRGCIETAAGQRRYFATLADLKGILTELGAWHPDLES